MEKVAVVKEEKLGFIQRIASSSVFSGSKSTPKSKKTTLRAEYKPFFSGLKNDEKTNIVEEERPVEISEKIVADEKKKDTEIGEDNLTDIPAFLRRQND